MKTNFLFLLLALGYSAAAQNRQPFSPLLITSKKTIDFHDSEKRGIACKSGMVYYVEQDLQTITAYKAGKVIWRRNVVNKCGLPFEMTPGIRYISLDPRKLFIVYGKHHYTEISVATGKIRCLRTG